MRVGGRAPSRGFFVNLILFSDAISAGRTSATTFFASLQRHLLHPHRHPLRRIDKKDDRVSLLLLGCNLLRT